MTRFEQIASAFPLRAQRIAELARPARTWLYAPSDDFDPKRGAAAVLRRAFTWSLTDEGYDYWNALYRGARQ